MNSMDTAVSMLEVMTEDQRAMVCQYSRQLLSSDQPSNPFIPLTTDQIMADLEESRAQAAEGRCCNMEEALTEMGKRHGFI